MSIRNRAFGWRSVLALVSVAFAAALVISIMAGPAIFDDATAQPEADGATVRISALKSESGAVRVALQQQDNAGGWHERQHPDLNTVRANAPTGIWLNSSPLQVSAESGQSGPLFCVVSHGATNDYFWRVVRGYSRQAAVDADANIRFFLLPDGADQAAAIERCSADGAAVVAATLADPDAVRDALLSAKDAGARIITFNSGAESAASVGSELHIALDDAEAGRVVGREFNKRGLTGDIGCLLHESRNVGLDARCEALAETYVGGETHRVPLPDGGNANAIGQAVADRLLDSSQPVLHALLALNADTLLASLEAIIATADQLDYAVQIAGVGQSPALGRFELADRQRHLAFVTSHAGEAQGYLITSALLYVHTYTTAAQFISTPTILTATPFIFDSTAIRADPEDVAAGLRRLEQRLILGEEYDE